MTINDGNQKAKEKILYLEVANKIKNHIEDATSMRELSQKAIEDAKSATRDNVLDQDLKITLVVDYCQIWRCLSLKATNQVRRTTTTRKTINLLGS
jgi:hypothetical protein